MAADKSKKFKNRVLPASQGRTAKKASGTGYQKRKRIWRDTPKRRRYLKLYGCQRWKDLRTNKLKSQPVCQTCRKKLATEVDHKIPHRGSEKLFFSSSNTKPICRGCHIKKSGRGL